jgi:hypothetical protein
MGTQIMVEVLTPNKRVAKIPMQTLLTWKAALKIEVNTGLRHSRGSVFNLAKDELDCHHMRRKTDMLELLTDLTDKAMAEFKNRDNK